MLLLSWDNVPLHVCKSARFWLWLHLPILHPGCVVGFTTAFQADCVWRSNHPSFTFSQSDLSPIFLFVVMLEKEEVCATGVRDSGVIINHIEVDGADFRNLRTQPVTNRAQFSVASRLVLIRMEDTSNVCCAIPFTELTSPHRMNRINWKRSTVKWQLMNAAKEKICFLYLFNWKQGAHLIPYVAEKNETFFAVINK